MQDALDAHAAADHEAALTRARRKAYLRLLPLLFLCYVIAYVDRANVSIAKLTMLTDPRLKGFDNAVIGFGAGEPDFPTAPHIVEAGVRALHNGETKYGPAGGMLELRTAIANHLLSLGIAATPDDVVVTPGSKPILLYSALALLENGDEALSAMKCGT